MTPEIKNSDVNRRHFMKGTSFASMMALLGAIEINGEETNKVAGVPKADPNYKEKPPAPPLNFGVIGLGAHGREILGTLNRLPNGPIVAICDTYKTSIKRAVESAPKATTHSDFKELLDNKEVQAVVIATPTHLHREIALAAMQSGKHVYLESPMAHSLEDARAIATAAKGLPKNQVFQVGQQLRPNPQNHHVYKFIRTGVCGRNAMAKAQWNKKVSWRRASPNPERERALNWRLYKETSLGLLGELGIHSVDVASWYFGAKPLAITAFGAIQQWQDDREVADTVQAIYEFPEGVRMTFGATLASSFEGESQTFYGSDATVLLRDNKAWMFKETDAPLLGWEVYARKDEFLSDSGIALVANATKILAQGKKPAEAASESDSPLRYSLEKFIEHAHEGTKPDCGWKEGFEANVVAIKSNEALIKGGRLVIEKDLFQI